MSISQEDFNKEYLKQVYDEFTRIFNRFNNCKDGDVIITRLIDIQLYLTILVFLEKKYPQFDIKGLVVDIRQHGKMEWSVKKKI